MSNPTHPLTDTTVLELGHIVAGPYCAMLLADFGAEVVKIEHPEHGDAFRRDQANSSFNYYNRNKRGVTIDLKDDEGRTVFLDLVREADVLIENFGPGTVDNLDIGYEDLAPVNEALIYCSVKGFNDGPYENRPALDPVAEALGGLMSTTGYPDHPPARCGTSAADMTASLHGALAVVAALHHRERTGAGQHITAPMFESVVALMGGSVTHSSATGTPKGPWGGGGQGQWAPYGVYQTKDQKWMFIGPSSQKHWENLCDAMGLDGLKDDERFRTLPDRREHIDELNDRLDEVFAEYTQAELEGRLVEEDVPAAPVKNTLEVLDDPHLEAIGGLGEVTTVNDDRVQVPLAPIRSTGFEPVRPTDPPKQGADTDDVLRSMGYSADKITELRDRGAI